jgi:large subunit ribosomal protein L4
MATIDIYNLGGEKVGTLDLADEIFGAVNEDLLESTYLHGSLSHPQFCDYCAY